jgi:transcriptional regulator with XRE-family HTH domain
MQQKIREIASRVRELRELSEITVEQMAESLDLPILTYQRYENGSEDIPASILYKIATDLQVDMGLLLTGDMPRMHIFTVTRKGKGIEVERRKQYSYQNLAANFIHKKAEPFLVTVDPRPAGGTPHRNAHPGQEFNFLLEGRLKIYIHNNEIELEEGDSIYFDANYEHAMEALDGRPAKFLAIIL